MGLPEMIEGSHDGVVDGRLFGEREPRRGKEARDLRPGEATAEEPWERSHVEPVSLVLSGDMKTP